MAELSIAFVIVLLLALASAWADRRFSGEDRLPMQWSFDGQVNWTASRRIALAFTPTLAALILGGTAIALQLSGDPRPGQEGLGPPVVLMMGLMFLGIHALHLWGIDRTRS